METTNTTNKPDTLAVTAADAAKLLGISRGQWFKLHAMGRVPRPVRLGQRAPRWRRVELEAWLAAGCPDRETWERARSK